MNEEQQDMRTAQQPMDGKPIAVPPTIQQELTEGRSSRQESSTNSLLLRFAEDFRPTDRGVTPFQLVDDLLKHPGRVIYEISQGRRGLVTAMLFAKAVVCSAMYGLVMGSFSGGPQLWIVPAKVVVGLLLSALICLPSLHILTSLAGGNQSFGETTAILLVNLALSGILLVGFAPIAWIFSQSTNAAAFMGGLHLLIWGVGAYFSLRLMRTSLSFLNRRAMNVLTLWGLIFTVVVFQMCTTLRPLVDEFSGFRLQEKEFFLKHWFIRPCGGELM